MSAPSDTQAAESAAPSSEKKRKKKKDKSNLASRRGIETLFRTSYREQLELTALADSKANIMIQLNGVIVSIMLASSGVIVESHAWLRLPSAALTLTSLVSIVFAVLAARPNLKKPSAMRFEDIRNGKANILFFGNFARLSEEEFVEGMWEMFGDSERVYLNMTRHIHGMGSVLLRKFRLLRVAYTVFLSGLFVSAALFLFTRYVVPAEASSQASDSSFQILSGMYEPSGVVQLPDGRVLAVEDEPERPLALLSMSGHDSLALDRSVDMLALLAERTPSLGKLNDLEGAAVSGEHVYVVTSLSGKPRKSREKLVRFSWQQDGTPADVRVRGDLRESLSPRVSGPLNVEALAFDAGRGRLLLGLRSPLSGGQALVIPIAAGEALFDGPLDVGEPIRLPLDGAGIRGMAYDPTLGGFVLISHREGPAKSPFELWLWDGQSSVRRLRVSGTDLRTAEGVTPIVINGEKRLLIVSDDGVRSLDVSASYVLLRYDQLSAES